MLFTFLIVTTRVTADPQLGLAIPAPVKSIQDQLGPTFKSYASPHFAIISDCPAAFVAKIGDMAEKTAAGVTKFVERLGVPVTPPKGRMTVLLFEQLKEFQACGRKFGFESNPGIPGFFDEKSNCCFMFNYANAPVISSTRREVEAGRREAGGLAGPEREKKLARIRQAEAQIAEYELLVNRTVIQHEIAHQVLFNIGLQSRSDHMRRWLKEGLAMQFETPGAPNTYRQADYEAIAADRRLDLLRRVVGDPKVIGPGAPQAAEAYACAWALVYYFSEKRPAMLATFMRDTPISPKANACPKPGAELERYEKAFGPLDAAFVDRLNQFIQRQTNGSPADRR